MKCLFIIQGEGRGHATQAIALKQILDSINIQVSAAYIGKNHNNRNHNWVFDDLSLSPNYFYSPNFIYKNNEVNFPLTAIKTLKNIKNIRFSIGFLHQEIKKYNPDFIVNFYEPLTPFANHNLNKPVITIGHQYMLDHQNYPNPKKWRLHKKIILLFNKLVAHNSKHILALSYYQAKHHNPLISVAPPLLRKSILNAKPHITPNKVAVYLINPEQIHNILSQTPNYPNHTFIIYNEKYTTQTFNTSCVPISPNFIQDLLSSQYVICSGGFETICEAHYHNKHILAVPTKNHTEQILNTIDASSNNIIITNNNYNLSQLLSNNTTAPSSTTYPKESHTQFYTNFFKYLLK
jgi:uncharacterized protein (TIGR00661 family)